MPTKTEFAYIPQTPIGSVMNTVAESAHTNAVKHGFYEETNELMDYFTVNDKPEMCEIVKRDFTLAQLAKIASEIGEAVSAIQHDEEYQLREELADIVIRTFDLCSWLGFRIGDTIMKKMAINEQRPHKHGKKC